MHPRTPRPRRTSDRNPVELCRTLLLCAVAGLVLWLTLGLFAETVVERTRGWLLSDMP